MGDLKKMRDVFAEVVEILDNLIALNKREEFGEDITEELAIEAGRLMVQLMKINALQKEV